MNSEKPFGRTLKRDDFSLSIFEQERERELHWVQILPSLFNKLLIVLVNWPVSANLLRSNGLHEAAMKLEDFSIAAIRCLFYGSTLFPSGERLEREHPPAKAINKPLRKPFFKVPTSFIENDELAITIRVRALQTVRSPFVHLQNSKFTLWHVQLRKTTILVPRLISNQVQFESLISKISNQISRLGSSKMTHTLMPHNELWQSFRMFQKHLWLTGIF